jgi:hypothetical protein
MAFTEDSPLTPFEDLLNDVVGALDNRLQADVDSCATVGGSVVSTVVNFPVAFAVAPRVTVDPITNRPDLISMSHSQVTTTGFTAYMHRVSGSGAVQFDWVAVVE